MKTTPITEALDDLKAKPDSWAFDRESQLYTARIGDYTLEVLRAGGHAEWRVVHADFGQLIEWTPNAVAAWAKNEAIDFCRAHVLGRYHPQHAE